LRRISCSASLLLIGNASKEWRDAQSPLLASLLSQREKGHAKISICSNFASVLSAAGWRVLIVDLDTQSNQSVLFGVDADDPALDEGKGLLAAVLTGDTAHVTPICDVRPGVDLIPAGVETRKLSDYLATRSSQAERCEIVRSTIRRLGAGYDLVVIDSRPSGELLGELVLLADYVVIPTRTDSMSWDRGLTTIADLYDVAEADARILGIAIFATARGATKVQAETREQLTTMLGGVAAVRPGERAMLRESPMLSSSLARCPREESAAPET
jgi:cellulose biosynthesis protein BcsQ